MKDKRILVVAGIYPPDIGGPATHLAQFLPHLVKNGVKVELVTFGDRAYEEVDEQGISICRISRTQSAAVRFFHLCRAVLVRIGHTDLIYLHDMSLVGLAVCVARLYAPVPYVLRLGGDYVWESAFQAGATKLGYRSFQGNEPRGYRLRRRLGTYIVRRACAVIVPSVFLKKVIIAWGIAPDSVHVVPNAIDTESLRGGTSTSEVLAEIHALQRAGKKVVVTSGRFVRRKHFDAAIRAMRQTTGVHLLLIGEGPEEETYRTLIEKCNVADRVSLVPVQPRAELFCVLAAADCFLLLDEGETFSFITLEALLAGTPAVLTRAGALEEIFGAYEGMGVTFLIDRTEKTVAARLSEIGKLVSPSAAVQQELAERYSIARHLAAVHTIMRDTFSYFK